jgi:hypothetical protein
MHPDSDDKSKEHSGSRREAAPVSSSTMPVDGLMPTSMAIGATLASN